jgi:paraquat-inducible protein A
MPPLGAVAFLAGILVPLLKILGNLYGLVSVRLGAHPPGLAQVFRWTQRLHPWAMTEVYLLGLIVAYVRIQRYGGVETGVATVAFVAMILVMLAADANLDPHAVWARIQPQAGTSLLRPRPGTVLVGCDVCDQLVHLPETPEGHDACPRCRARLHRRKPDSVGRTSALLLTAAFLYVPANLLPMLSVTYLGWSDTTTILQGIKELVGYGMLPVAILVLFASIVVPIFKVAGLGFLIVSVRRRSAWRPRGRTLLYRIIEGIGRWSMVDVFMISILTSLVRLGNLAEVTPERGALAFAAVVVTTMLAAMTFDPRLIWDAIDERPGHQAAPAA